MNFKRERRKRRPNPLLVNLFFGKQESIKTPLSKLLNIKAKWKYEVGGRLSEE
jgi:hypothetical protein